MMLGNWLAILARHVGGAEGITWDDVVVGHDFGFLKAEEIQVWIRGGGFQGEATDRVYRLEGVERATRFEAALWKASAEQTGKAPRPGGQRWGRAQDRWRLALLKDVLEAPLSPEALGVAVETIYESVGCPEDMLGLWEITAPWSRQPPRGDREAIARFVNRREADLVREG